MKKISTRLFALFLALMSLPAFGQLTPEVLYYDFNGTGTTVPNLASAPPVGTTTANIMGGVTQGSSGLCNGALIGTGVASSTDYLNTGWAPNLGTGSWTFSFRTNNVTGTSTLYYIFGDVNTASFRCFTNGVAGANNWILRGAGITDVLATGGAQTYSTMTTFVYDNALNNIKAYVNGVLVNTVAQTAPTITGTGPFKVMGYSSNVGMSAGGQLDEFRVYSRALTAAEVAQLYNPFSTSAFLGSDFNLCPAGSALITLGWPSSTVLWSTGSTNDSITVNTGGLYYVDVTGACGTGTDSILASGGPSSSTLSASVCDSYTAPSGAVLTASGTYMDTITNAAGCDSVITINLTVGYTTTATINPIACMMYTSPSGQMYTSSGTYMDTIPNTSGCDSVITINLTVGSESQYAFSASVCQSYTAPSGAVYTSSGTYMDTIPSALGCDSVMTITLTVNQPSAATLTVNSCGMYTAPSGATYMSSGTYMDTIPNMAGCDSIMTIQLSVYTATSSSMSASACDTYTAPSGAMYSATGTYMDTIPNVGGCDSVITIQLTITNSTTSSMNASACNSYTAPSGAVYTSSGSYMDTIPNMAGCDSIITIGLQITPLDTTVTPFGVGGLQAAQSGATYQWIDCSTGNAVPGATQQTFVPSVNGYYMLAITNGSCTDTSACWPAFPIGIEENFAGNISIYPNPNSGNFVINLGGTYSDVSLVITDLAGRVVFATTENSTNMIPVQLDAAAGTYIVNIVSGENIASFRITKE